jgi:hypothetical protein
MPSKPANAEPAEIASPSVPGAVAKGQ